MKTIEKRRFVAALSTLAAAAVLVAACGGGDDNSTRPEPAQTVVMPADNGLAAAAAPEFTKPAATDPALAVQLNNATANAGNEPFFVNVIRKQWCASLEAGARPAELADTRVVPMVKIMDDAYFAGTRSVGQYVFKAGTGLFLIDTLNNTAEVQSITEPGLAAMGLRAGSILAAMPTHGHGDHLGGAAYLQTTYGTPIYLGSADQAGRPFVVTPVDSANMEPQDFVVGDLKMKLLSTPGHTPGTFSGVVPVHHKGQAFKLVFWGGTSMPSTLPAAIQYLNGTERLYKLARSEKVDGTMHTHGFVDGSLAHVDEIVAKGLSGDNPFLIGNERALRSLAVLRNCAAAKTVYLDATQTPSQWLVTKTEVASTFVTNQANGNLSASARVSSPYGAAANVPVNFSFAAGGEKCSALTDERGVATCTVSSVVAQTTVTAEAQGTPADPAVVYLPSAAEAKVTALN